MKFSDTTYTNCSPTAEELSGSLATIENWSKQEDFPPPVIKSGKTLIYRTNDVVSWLEREV